MDDSRFDRLTRQVAQQTDRRTMVKTAIGGTLALLALGTIGRKVEAESGREGGNCFTDADCETGLVCEGVTTSFIGGLIAEGFGPPDAGALFGPRPGTCRYRSGDNCTHSGQFCQNDSDCCNGLNLTCHNNKCERRD